MVEKADIMGKFTEFQLPLKKLTPGEHHFDFTLDKEFFEHMESSDVRDAALSARVDVNYKGDIYDLAMHIEGEVTVQCDRCLDEMQLPIDAAYHIMVKFGDAYRDDSDELLEIPDSQTSLNIAYMLYDTASLAIPIKHVHPLGKCNRQMSAALRRHRATIADDEDAELQDALVDEMETLEAGGAQPTDPRWDALRDIAGDNDDTAGSGC